MQSLSIFSRMNVIVATDSRGRNLHSYILNHKSMSSIHNLKVSYIFKPGAQVHILKHEIEYKLQHIQTQTPQTLTSVTLIAGICNFTKIIKVFDDQGKMVGTQIIYVHSKTALENIIDQLRSMSTKFNTKTITFKIAAIPPANLQKYTMNPISKGKLPFQTYSDTDLMIMQAHLEQNITQVNTEISRINSSHALSTIRWDRDIIKTVTKHRGRQWKYQKNNKIYIHSSL